MNPPGPLDMGDDSVDGGWGQWGRLVLHELTRQNGMIIAVDSKLTELLTKEAAKTERDTAFRLEVERKLAEMDAKHDRQYQSLSKLLEDKDEGLVPRMETMEAKDEVRSAVQLDRKWIIGILITFVFSIIIPLISFIRDLMSGA